MSLAPFLNRHAGETAWLFGKGPGLNTFDLSQAGPLRVAINDVAAHVPDVRYCFSNDGVANWRDIYAPGPVLFQPVRALGEFDSTKKDAVACEVVTYRYDWDDELLFQPRERLAECLAVRRGTLGSALQILHIMGVAKVVLVGIDGGNAHAEGYAWRTRLRREHWKDYNAIRDGAIDAAELLGITLHFHNPTHTMEQDGKVWVKITRNCFAGGVPYGVNQLVKLNPKVAGELVSIGSAVSHDGPPAKASPEKASDPSEKETAAMPAAKRTSKKAARKQAK